MRKINRKGMNTAIAIIVAIVVLLIVGLAVVAVTSNNLHKFQEDTAKDIDSVGKELGNVDKWIK